MRFLSKNITLNLFLTLVAAMYYLPFINKGIILFDEGYMLHFAQRITLGQVPYYDFFVQYTPGFFYLLALFFKLFGTTVLTGRILTVVIAIGIILSTLIFMDTIKLHSFQYKIPVVIILIALGFPLINVPIDVWPCILLSVGLMIVFVKWSESTQEWKFASTLGILLSLMMFMKQNLGLGYLALLNILFLFTTDKKYTTKIKNMAIIDGIFGVVSIPWIYYFFIRSGDLSEFLRFSHDFVTTHPFSYPPLTYLFQPLGILKLLPYYLPFAFLLLLLHQYFIKKERSILLYTSIFPLVGFILTIIPLTDLIHIYPFLGLSVVMFFIFIQTTKLRFKKMYMILLALTVIIGFYLTFFRGQYRYGDPYRFDTTLVNLPAAKVMLVSPTNAKELEYINSYINTHTKKSDYIFVYPFSPMLYFLVNRQNPTRYGNLIPGNVTYEQEKQIVATLKEKKVSVVLTVGNFAFTSSPISQWVVHHTVLVENNSLCQIRKVVK